MVYVDSQLGSINGLGTRESPFASLFNLSTWLSALPSFSNIQVRALIAPGSYPSYSLAIGVDFTLQKCLDCREGLENQQPVLIEVSHDSLLYTVYPSQVTLSNLTFVDSHLKETLPEKPIIFALQAKLKISDCIFSGIQRTTTLVSAYSSQIKLDRVTAIDNCIKPALPSRDKFVGGLFLLYGDQTEVLNSHFENNSLLIAFYIPTDASVGGTVIHASNRVTLRNSTWQRNVLDPRWCGPELKRGPTMDGAGVARGTVFLSGDSPLLEVYGCRFESNMVMESRYYADYLDGGAAISTTDSADVSISDTEFIDNRGPYGSALHFFEFASKAPLVPKKRTISFQNVFAANNTCNRGGCLLFMTSNSAPVEVTITNMIVSGGSLSEYASLGGLFYASLPNSEPVDSSFSAYNLTISGFTAQNDLLALIILDRVLRVDITHSNFLIVKEGLQIIKARSFNSVSIDKTQISAQYCSLDPYLLTLLEFSDDLTFVGDNPTSVSLKDISITDICAKSAVKLSRIRSASIENVSFVSTHFRTPFRSMPFIRAFEASKISASLYMSRIIHSGVGIFALDDIATVFLEDCYFGPSAHSERITHRLSLNHIGYSSIDSTAFDMNNEGAAIRLSFSNLAISNSSFNRCTPPIGQSGGAIFAEFSQLNVSNSLFAHCRSGDSGGALYLQGRSFIEDVTFLNNSAPARGGAIYCREEELNILRSTFKDNRADQEGGAIFLLGQLASTPGAAIDAGFTIVESTFMNNSASSGGAVFSSPDDGVNALISRSNFIRNSANNDGGAIYHSAGTNSEISYCGFFNNTVGQDPYESLYLSPAPKPWRGSISNPFSRPTYVDQESLPRAGALMVPSGTARIDFCEFAYNTAEVQAGAVFLSGMVEKHGKGSYIRNSKFVGNAAGVVGGALSFSRRVRGMYGCTYPITIDNSSFVDNQAQFGGAIEYSPFPWCNVPDWPFEEPDSPFEEPELPFEEPDASFGEIGSREVKNTVKLHPEDGIDARLKKMSAKFGNSSFVRNVAFISGGAIYTSAPEDQYFHYQNLLFVDNTAQTSGGTFFFNWARGIEKEILAPDFCNSTYNCTVLNTLPILPFAPLWGETFASSGWVPFASSQPPFTLINPIGLQTPSNSSVHPNILVSSSSTRRESSDSSKDAPLQFLDYRLNIAFKDLFGQLVKEYIRISAEGSLLEPPRVPVPREKDAGKKSLERGAVPSPKPSDIDRRRDIKFSVESSINSIRVVILAGPMLVKKQALYSTKSDGATSLSKPIDVTFSFFISLPELDRNSMSEDEIVLDVTMGGCPTGYGLISSESNRPFSYGSCEACPVSTYNLDGDGYCYLCNDPSTTHVSCEKNSISYRNDFWTSSMRGTNLLVGQKCLLGHCQHGACLSNRHGPFCASCTENSSESLFSTCSPTLCRNRSVFLIIVVPIAIVIFTLGFHLVIMRWPGATMFWLICAQISCSLISKYVDWSVPLLWPSIASLLCGWRMNAIERYYVLTFTPYLSIAVLASLGMIAVLMKVVSHLLLDKETRLFLFIARMTSSGAIADWKRIAMTCLALLYAIAFSSLGRIIDWFMCRDTPIGSIWLVAPNILCSDKKFVQNRIVFNLLAVPLVSVPLIATLFFLISDLRKRMRARQQSYELLTAQKNSELFATAFPAYLFYFASSYASTIWAFVDLTLLRFVLPVLHSVFSVYNQSAEATWISTLLLVVTGLSTFYTPHFTLPMKYASTVYLCALSALAMLSPMLSANARLPLVSLCVTFALLGILAVILIVRRPERASSHEDSNLRSGVDITAFSDLTRQEAPPLSPSVKNMVSSSEIN